MDFKNILLTTDLSQNAEAAAPYAGELARKYGGSIRLIHVFEDLYYYVGTTEDVFGALTSAQTGWVATAKAERQAKLTAAAAALSEAEKVPVEPVLRFGHAVHEIIRFAEEQKIGCLVIATHGHTGFSHLLFGSVAERVVRMAPCPVLSIRPKHKA